MSESRFLSRPAVKRTIYRKWILALLIVILTLAAVQRLGDGFDTFFHKPEGAIDLKLRYRDVQRWFQGEPVYTHPRAVYPPASYVVLWPLLGWLDLPRTELLWALTTLAALAWLSVLAVKASRVKTRLERTAVFLVPLAVYSARAVIVNGQLMLHLLPPLLAGFILLEREPSDWKKDLGAAALLLIGLVKLTVAIPFMLILLTKRRFLRPMIFLGSGYVMLTSVAAMFQHVSPLISLKQWLPAAVSDAARASADSHANLHYWLGSLGLRNLNLPASILLLVLLGIGLYLFRQSDIWIRLGIAAIVARIWTFHYRYDDMLLVVPLIALLRLGLRPRAMSPEKIATLSILALLSFTLLAPARFFFLPGPWSSLYESFQTIVWLASLALLVYIARRESLHRPVP